MADYDDNDIRTPTNVNAGDVEKKLRELDNWLRRNEEEKEKLASFVQKADTAIQAAKKQIETVKEHIETAQECIKDLSKNHKEFLDENESLIRAAFGACTRLTNSDGIGENSTSICQCEKSSSNFISPKAAEAMNDSQSGFYQAELKLKNDLPHNEGVKRCIYYQRNPTPSEKKPDLISRMNKQPHTQDTTEVDACKIDEYTDEKHV